MRGGSLRRWRWIHEWSSLLCTLFLLVLCLTGLPLIFSDEIDGANDGQPSAATASLDPIVASIPRTPAFVRIASDEGLIYVGPGGGGRPLLYDAQTGRPVHGGMPKPPGLTGVILALHAELFAGLWGRLFIAAVGLSALLSVVSGILIYAPFAGRRPFGDVRSGRHRRLAWLDRHNVMGIASALWLLVVTTTGFMNAIERPLFNMWRATISRTLPRPHGEKDVIGPQQALLRARSATSGMALETVIFPGGPPGIPGYYLVWGTGTEPLTKRLSAPVAIDAATGAVAGGRELPMPWYLRLLDLSRPLHFGDYGGLPLKILWALLDLVTIVVLGTGVYLWIARHRRERGSITQDDFHGPRPAKELAE